MANMLKNMRITSVDLVEAGANQEADINFFKGRAEDMPTEFSQILKALEDINNRLESLEKSKNEFDDSEVIPEETESIPEESGVIPEESEVTQENEEEDELVNKSLVNERIQKLIDVQLSEIKKENESIRKQNEDLKKSLELVEFKKIAQKYQAIGENPEELAQTLYEYKKAGDNFYEPFVAALDKSLSVQNETGIFKEFGTGRSNENTSQVDAVLKSYTDSGMSQYEAYIKAAQEHPELLHEYDSEYFGG